MWKRHYRARFASLRKVNISAGYKNNFRKRLEIESMVEVKFDELKGNSSARERAVGFFSQHADMVEVKK